MLRVGRPDAHGLVGEAHVERARVGLGVHGHGADAELLASADDAQRDLTAVGDEDLLEHRPPAQAFLTRKSFWPNSTALPFCAKISTMVPEHVGLDLVHQLHRFDDAERLSRAHHRADLDERRRVGAGRAVERPDEGARHVDRVVGHGRLGARRRRAPARACATRHRGAAPRRASRRDLAAHDADASALVLVLELPDVVLDEEVEQRLAACRCRRSQSRSSPCCRSCAARRVLQRGGDFTRTVGRRREESA